MDLWTAPRSRAATSGPGLAPGSHVLQVVAVGNGVVAVDRLEVL